jgi:large subunit ribosomal protein L24
VKKFRLRKGDNVVVISGKFKKLTGEIIAVDRDNDRVFVKGINVVRRHQRPSVKNPEGVFEKEASIHISNVAYWDDKASKASRIGFRHVDGDKQRYAKKSGMTI